MTQSDWRKVFNYHIYPEGSIITFNKGYVNIENGSMGGTHWTCFHKKDKKSYCFDAFGGQVKKL